MEGRQEREEREGGVEGRGGREQQHRLTTSLVLSTENLELTKSEHDLYQEREGSPAVNLMFPPDSSSMEHCLHCSSVHCLACSQASLLQRSTKPTYSINSRLLFTSTSHFASFSPSRSPLSCSYTEHRESVRTCACI